MEIVLETSNLEASNSKLNIVPLGRKELTLKLNFPSVSNPLNSVAKATVLTGLIFPL